jgi:hypothetical protein
MQKTAPAAGRVRSAIPRTETSSAPAGERSTGRFRAAPLRSAAQDLHGPLGFAREGRTVRKGHTPDPSATPREDLIRLLLGHRYGALSGDQRLHRWWCVVLVLFGVLPESGEAFVVVGDQKPVVGRHFGKC